MTTAPDELVRIRLEKLARLRAKGIDPYPRSYDRTHTTREAVESFESAEVSGEGEAEMEEVSIGGRITAMRGMGRVTFCDVMDGSGTIQSMLRSNVLGDDYDTIRDLDIGDWIGVSGPVMRTRTGEVTVQANQFTVLCKSLRSLPDKWHGLTDTETRYRHRYLDLISNPEARRIAILRSRMVSGIRRFMDRRGFIEVETPVLVPVPAGGMAHPFETHHNALDRDLFLRIATELHLKRLIVGGLEKVYEIGRIFRNEGIDQNHNPEFTSMESYEAFADYNDTMELVEEMVSTVAVEVNGQHHSRVWGRHDRLLPSVAAPSAGGPDRGALRRGHPQTPGRGGPSGRDGRSGYLHSRKDELGGTGGQAHLYEGRTQAGAAFVPCGLPGRVLSTCEEDSGRLTSR